MCHVRIKTHSYCLRFGLRQHLCHILTAGFCDMLMMSLGLFLIACPVIQTQCLSCNLLTSPPGKSLTMLECVNTMSVTYEVDFLCKHECFAHVFDSNCVVLVSLPVPVFTPTPPDKPMAWSQGYARLVNESSTEWHIWQCCSICLRYLSSNLHIVIVTLTKHVTHVPR